DAAARVRPGVDRARARGGARHPRGPPALLDGRAALPRPGVPALRRLPLLGPRRTLTTTTPPSTDHVTPPAAPDIPGLLFRRYRGVADHPDLVRIENLQARADGVPDRQTVDAMDAEFAHLTNCDLARDLLVAEVKGTPVAWT